MRLLFPKKPLLFVFLFLCLSQVFAQFKVPERPSKIYPIFDETGLLTPSEKENLNHKLISFHDSTSVEIAVVVLPTTNGEDVNFAAAQIGNEWKIGKKGKDNGIVLLIAKEDRKIAIQQGRDVEKYLTASVAGQIIDYLITPAFKKGNFYTGIDQGTTALMEAVQGKYKPEPKKEAPSDILPIIIILVIVLLIFFLKNKDDDDFTLSRGGRKNYGGGFFPFPMGGGNSRGSSGGGFGGFGGGGSFGGGGASGGW